MDRILKGTGIVIFVAVMGFLFFTGADRTLNSSIHSLEEERYTESAQGMRQLASGLIDQKARTTLLMALSLAENPLIRNWVEKNEPHPGTLDSFIQNVTGPTDYKNIWIQLVDNRGTSLYRTWNGKRGDSLLNKRIDVGRMIQHPEIISSISTGIFSMTFKSMVPVRNGSGKFIGSLEVITHFDSITRELQKSGVESIILVSPGYKHQITNPLTGTFLQNYYLVNRIENSELVFLLQSMDLSRLVQTEDHLILGSWLLTVHRIPDLENKPMGYVLLFRKLSGIDLTGIRNLKTMIQVSVPLILTFLLSIIITIFVIRMISRTRESNRNLESLVSARTYELQVLNRNLEQRVTEEMEKRLLQEQHLIEQNKLASMNQLICNLAHQWRQPLNTIALSIQNLEEAFSSGEFTEDLIHKSVQTSLNQIQYMSSTINGFTNYLNLPEKSIHYTSEEIIDFVKNSFLTEFSLKKVQFKSEGENLALYGDPNNLKQILINLVNNAIESIQRSQEKDGEITIHTSIQDHQFCFEVEDNGNGIPEELKDRIFEPYFTTQFKARGVGLSLYMSRLIAEDRMCGKLLARNTGKGALFSLIFPEKCTPIKES